MGGLVTFPYIQGAEMGYTWGVYLTNGPAGWKYLFSANIPPSDIELRYFPPARHIVSVLGRDEGYTVKYNPLPEGVPEGKARGNS